MTSTAPLAAEPDAPGASDHAVFAQLETAFGGALKDVLARYLAISDGLCQRLQDASGCAHWQEAVRVALQIGHEADELGFHRVAQAARGFADAAYHADDAHSLRNGAQTVVFEYERFRLALEMRFPDQVASDIASVA